MVYNINSPEELEARLNAKVRNIAKRQNPDITEEEILKAIALAKGLRSYHKAMKGSSRKNRARKNRRTRRR